MAPAVLRTILDHPRRDDFQAPRPLRFTVAGAPPPAAFIERLEEELGFEFIQIYGLTETAPLLTVQGPDFATERQGTGHGARAPGSRDSAWNCAWWTTPASPCRATATSLGEICARSNVVFKGYWEQPEETDRAIRDGWFHTGDLGVWDEVGNVHIADRKKDVIISGGENISSPEIEDALYQHPGILECAVIGVPHEKWGETPCAIVVAREGHDLGEQEVIDFCREHLAHFKCPTRVEVVDALPRTATGKLQKFKLREPYWEGERRVQG